jgi:hypothetical protein
MSPPAPATDSADGGRGPVVPDPASIHPKAAGGLDVLDVIVAVVVVAIGGLGE